jgi:hypothetical protein
MVLHEREVVELQKKSTELIIYSRLAERPVTVSWQVFLFMQLVLLTYPSQGQLTMATKSFPQASRRIFALVVFLSSVFAPSPRIASTQNLAY